MADLDSIAESEEVEDDSIAASLEAAFEAHGGDDEGETATQNEVDAVVDAPSEGESPEAGGEDTPKIDTPADTPADTEAQPDLDTAPSSLPPAAREAWKDAPEAIKAAVAKREKDYEQGILKYSADAKRANEMDTALRPFEQYLGMNGGTAHIGDLMRTGATLQMGTQIQKAQQISDLINQYGIDINTLDGLLSGNGAPQGAQQNDEVSRQIQAAMQPYEKMMQDNQRREQDSQHQSEQRVQSEIGTFSSDPANEFYADVRSDMADILDAAAKHGTEMSLKQAYDRACLIHPEISNVITARNSQQDLGAKRNAASSINGTRGGTTNATPTGSIRETLSHVYDNAGGRV
jgi:hypothetical protein